ncbi:hypothetical protein LNP20_04080 [Klebsiella pneumoniae subsp. pneumoniae]|nr:hypothetical protein [Klebsiella pneumoniae subsp. pneumoniae]
MLAAINALKEHNIAVPLDVVVNHKMGADEKRLCAFSASMSRIVRKLTRRSLSARHGRATPSRCAPDSIRSLSGDYKCFSGIDHIENPTEDGVFKIVNDYTGEGWNEQVDDELGNFDYLMGANIDFRNHAVTEEIKYWARWVMEQTGCDGFRLDAVKHIPAWFYKAWIEHSSGRWPRSRCLL